MRDILLTAWESSINEILSGKKEKTPWDYAIDLALTLERTYPNVPPLDKIPIPSPYKEVYMAWFYYRMKIAPKEGILRIIYNIIKWVGERGYVRREEFEKMVKKNNLTFYQKALENILLEDDFGNLSLGNGVYAEAITILVSRLKN